MAEKLLKLHGVIPAMVTPFDENEKLDLLRTRYLTDYLCNQEIGGLYLTGSTGEGFMMLPEEREAFVETVIDAAKGKVPVVVHVGAISTQLSQRLARHAAKTGAYAISSVPPIYWRFSNDQIAGYYEDIVQASGLPMIVYNIALAGLVSYDMLIRLGKLEGVAGVKYTAPTHYDFFRMKEDLGADFKIYSGSDEMALSGLSFGAHGLIGSTYNLLADRFIRLVSQFEKGDIYGAQETQEKANRLIFAMLQHDLNPTLKLLLKSEKKVDAGFSRRPFTRYTPEQEAKIIEDYRNAHGI